MADVFSRRCGCGRVFSLCSLKDRSTQCVGCQRRVAAEMNAARQPVTSGATRTTGNAGQGESLGLTAWLPTGVDNDKWIADACDGLIATARSIGIKSDPACPPGFVYFMAGEPPAAHPDALEQELKRLRWTETTDAQRYVCLRDSSGRLNWAEAPDSKDKR